MAENSTPMVGITPEQLKELLVAVVRENNKLNPIEQRKLDEELIADKRRTEMVLQLGKIEEEAAKAKKNACTHCVWPEGTRNAGKPAPRGQGIWCTGGQVHQDGTISLLCLRCSYTWRWNALPAEIQYAQDAEHGLLNFAPPPEERLIKDTEVSVA